MAKIYSYKKIADAVTTKQLDTSGIDGAVELCEINGLTYVSIPDAAKVATQDAAIDAKEVTPNAAQKTALRAKSYVVKFIKQQVRDRIREKYDLDDELKLLRLRDKDATAWTAFETYVEECRSWGETEIAKLGI